MDTIQLDSKKTDAFTERMVEILNSAALGLMTSVGHRTGLFDTLAHLPPATSERIAEFGGLCERYVREWLGAMVTGGIVEHNPADDTYHLPAEHAAALTRAASPNNMATTTQFFSLLGAVEDQIVTCFREGGGVSYSAYPRFHEVMAEQSDQSVVSVLLDSILPLAPEVLDGLRSGIEVLDVGCGSGHAVIRLAKAFPNSRFAGYDLSTEGISHARAKADRLRLSNVRFDVRDVSQLDEPGRYGLITAFDAVHDQAKPARVLKAVARALRSEGTFLMQDIAGSSHVHKNAEHPIAPFLYTISCMHCMTVSLAQSGDGLGAMWGREKAQQMLAEAGFRKVQVEQLPHDIINYYYIAKL